MGYGCFRRYFLDHPERVNESYVTHGINASWFGCRLVVFGLFEFIHAVIPGIDVFELCHTSSRNELEKMCNELKIRKNI